MLLDQKHIGSFLIVLFIRPSIKKITKIIIVITASMLNISSGFLILEEKLSSKMRRKEIFLIVIVIILILAALIINKWWNKKYAKVNSVTTLEVCGDSSNIVEMEQPHILRQPIPEADEKEYRAFNPSVTLLEDDLVYSYRISNYTACPASTGKPRRPIFASNDHMKSFIMLEDGERNVLHLDLPPKGEKGCCGGFEDARLIVNPSQTELFMITNARMGSDCISQMHLIRIPVPQLKEAFKSPFPRTLKVSDSQILPLHYDDGSEKPHHEKNWMPFFPSSVKNEDPSDENLCFVYSINPHVILRCDLETGECEKIAETFNPNIDKNLRGSSQVRMHKGKYVAVAHLRTSSHSYLSQVYTFSPQYPYAVEEISPTFIFDVEKKKGNSFIQFVSGFEIKDDIAYITYGEHDCDSKLFTTSMNDLMNSLKKVEQTNLELNGKEGKKSECGKK